MPETKPNIYQRLASAALALPGGVHKDVTVRGGGNYKAVGHGQVVERTRTALLSNGVLYFVQADPETRYDVAATRNGDPVNVVHGVFLVEFVNTDEPTDRFSVRVLAQGIDSQDKAFPKASSYAKKLALMQALQLFGDDDAQDEARDIPDPVPMQPAVPSRGDIITLAKRNGVPMSEVQAWCLLRGAERFESLADGAKADLRGWLQGGGGPVDHASEAPAAAVALLKAKPDAPITVAEFFDRYNAQGAK